MIVLLLGVATVVAFVRAGDDDGGSRLAQTGPGTTAASTSTTSSTSTTTASPATTAPPGATGATGGTGATATTGSPTGATATTGADVAGSGLGAGGAGQVAMGPTIPNTGIESALAPGVALLGVGVGLRLLLAGRRHRDA